MKRKFPERLRELRMEKDLTKEKLAQKLGIVSDVTIGKWESGKHEPVLGHLVVLAKFFAVSIDYLAGLEDE